MPSILDRILRQAVDMYASARARADVYEVIQKVRTGHLFASNFVKP